MRVWLSPPTLLRKNADSGSSGAVVDGWVTEGWLDAVGFKEAIEDGDGHLEAAQDGGEAHFCRGFPDWVGIDGAEVMLFDYWMGAAC